MPSVLEEAPINETDPENTDHHCKTRKLQHLESLVKSISDRTEAWLQYAKDDPGVKGLQSLFSKDELNDATRYVPRWPLFVHLAAAIWMMSASAYYHIFYCENAERRALLRCFDYSGICIMIGGSTTAPFYYGFMCDENRHWG